MGEEQAKPCVGSSASKAFEFIPVVRGEKEGRRGRGGGGKGRGRTERGGGGGGGKGRGRTERARDRQTDRDSYTKRQREVGGQRGGRTERVRRDGHPHSEKQK